MSFFLTNPLYLISLISIILLLVIYFLHRRTQKRKVSALFLWPVQETTQNNGLHLKIRRLPLSFFREAAALACLAIAAAMPFWLGKDDVPVLVVILDNSYSMQAGSPSVKSLCKNKLEDYLHRIPNRRVIWYLAGSEATLLADSTQPFDYESKWTVHDIHSNLSEALAEAKRHCPNAEYLLVTDHQPDFILQDDTACIACGSPRPNLAIVTARRDASQLLLEIANFSDKQVDATLSLSISQSPVTLAFTPHEQKKLAFALKDLQAPVTIEISSQDDSLSADNRITLVSEPRPPLRYAIINNLPQAATSLLEATLHSDYARSDNPELIITAPDDKVKTPAAHRLIWHCPQAENTVFSSAPVIPLGDIPLLRGLDFTSVRWPADHSLELPGTKLLIQDKATLLSAVKRPDGFMDYHLNLYPNQGNLHRLPAWPSLFWNLADILRDNREGPLRRNWNLGELVKFQIHNPTVKSIKLTGPVTRDLPVLRRMAIAGSLPPGIYVAKTGDISWELSVTALSAAESNLSNATTITRSLTPAQRFSTSPRHPLAWLFAILAILFFIV